MLDALIKIIRAAVDTVLVRFGQGVAAFIASVLGVAVPAVLALDPANQPTVKSFLQPPQAGNLQVLFPQLIDLIARALQASLLLAVLLGVVMVLQFGLRTSVSYPHTISAIRRASRLWYGLYVLLMAIGYFTFFRLSPIYDNVTGPGQLSNLE